MRYLGSKDSLAYRIVDLLREKGLLQNKYTFCDGFCGMGAVADAVKNTYMGHRTKRFFQWSGKMGERF